ncbi:hypothetical protein KUTeg_021186 [Tegillarca granosa]|uniref:Purple acid phosphatase n=1 Tax=Tegillarca granosa TaxID=220873 RepID=A0ABQ9EA13_TEGGR|nr:hypothetical protein KUTeg_021186 [Tegillarca granosa]
MDTKVLNCCVIVHTLLALIPLHMTAHLQDFKSNKNVEKSTKNMELHPDQIHLSLGKKSNDVIVMWASSFDDESVVEYHTGEKAQLKEKKGETIHFTSNTQGRQYLHRVELSDLEPGTKYYYAVRGKTEKLISDQYSFVVPGKHNVQTYMIYGDMGTQSTNVQFIVHEAILEDKSNTYEAIFHIGDIAYDLGKSGGTVGDKFLNTVQKMTARIPYMTVPGDHDLFHNDQYRYRFSMPGCDWPMKSDHIDVGFVHFVGISTEIFFGGSDNTTNSENILSFMKWLQNDLQKANENRRQYPWVIVMGHRPLYCSVDDKNEDCTKEDSVVRNKLENMFYSYGVDLYISGHNHIYERTLSGL